MLAIINPSERGAAQRYAHFVRKWQCRQSHCWIRLKNPQAHTDSRGRRAIKKREHTKQRFSHESGVCPSVSPYVCLPVRPLRRETPTGRRPVDRFGDDYIFRAGARARAVVVGGNSRSLYSRASKVSVHRPNFIHRLLWRGCAKIAVLLNEGGRRQLLLRRAASEWASAVPGG